jgi:hypothetical protein
MTTTIRFWSYLAQFVLEWEMFQTKVVERVKTHILCGNKMPTRCNSTLHRQLENRAPNTTDNNHLYNTLELLMMGIKVPETC